MPNSLSTLGVAHTLISLLPLGAGLYGFVRFGRIHPGTTSGRLYLVGLALSVVTSFGLSSTGGLNPGHLLGVLALVAALSSLLVPQLAFLGRLRPFLETLGPSFSFFLLLVPGTVETLKRLPVAHPIATGPDDPLVGKALLALLVLFIAGFVMQCRAILSNRQRVE
ncbi:hypothetical protein [Piscinibacter sp. HJYY11]|uniref:hypothetical protein n=1 Tax=Piscinibacter sp. HJYY11 TaxID=2801333 RepID=UPI00191FCBC6|nr:hypothetical protein [Piscinibacter sp. HJYY11]MBL0727307.1 hypothetical protein [Piscinibacter sp. HJYY11]